MGTLWLLLVFHLQGLVISSFIYDTRMPDNVKNCFLDAKVVPVDDEHAENACLLSYYQRLSEPRELTEGDRVFFRSRIDSRFGVLPPPTGFRKRKEIRTLTDIERRRFFTVVTSMYWDGTLHRFGRLHGQTKKKVHKGAAFLPWHRMFILDFEEEMRKRDPKVFLPYWDYTMDNNISRPSDSVVWSDCFFGNGLGIIKNGPFRNWYGGHSIQIVREYARGGQCPPRLINKIDIRNIMKKCHFTDITTGSAPYFDNPLNIEMLHDGVHDWVGGDMDELPFSAFDPVFFMHHAFIDYIWEKFREHQIQSCRVDPETDWRPMDDLGQKGREDMGPFDVMYGYPHLRNIDGNWNNLTKVFYNYEEQPRCPDCGHSRFLYCDKQVDPRYPEGLCLTRTKDVCRNEYTTGEKGPLQYLEGKLLPSHPCHSQHLLNGLPGDGRHRDLSVEESAKILQKETAKGLHIDQKQSQNDTYFYRLRELNSRDRK